MKHKIVSEWFEIRPNAKILLECEAVYSFSKYFHSLSEEKPLWRTQQSSELMLRHNDNFRNLVSNLTEEKQTTKQLNDWILSEYGDRFGVPER